MTQVGYRKTSPPQVFVDFSREAVEAIGENNFSLYKDPLDLKNSMKSFSYTLTKGDVPGRMDIQLIDPSQRVEADLFAWFAAINPRSWRAKQDAPNPENAAKYWAAKALESVKFFVRWGYISDPEDSSSPAAALSHIHEMLLFDIGYEVSDKQERIVTLQLQTQQDISLMRQAENSTKMFDQTIKTPIERATPEGIVLKEPAEIVTEMIGRLISGGGTIGGCFPSEEQRQVINKAFDALGTRQLPTGDNLDLLQNATYNYENKDASLMGYNTVLEFFNGLGMDVRVNVGNTNPSPAPDRTLSVAQNPSLTPTRYRGNTGAGVPTLDIQAGTLVYDFPLEKLEITTDAVDLSGDRSVDPPAPAVINEAILINPFKRITEQKPLSAPDGYLQDPLSPSNSYVSFYSDVFTIEDLEKTLQEDVVYLLPKVRAGAYELMSYATNGPINDLTTPNDLLAVNGIITGPPGPFGPRPTLTYSYKPSEHPEIKAWIEFFLNKRISGADEVREQAALDELQQELRAEGLLLEANPIGTTPPPPNSEDEDVDGSYVSITTASRDITLQKFLDKFNTTFFEDAADYLTYTHIPLSLVDRKDRAEFQSKFAKAEIDWEKETGLTLVSTLRYANDLISFMGKIDSFDIQIPEKPERVILSTGFSKNKTNIITDLSYRQSKAGWFFEFLQSPIIMQQVYDIAERFETQEYRDAVWRHIELAIDPNARPSVIRVYPEGSPDSTQFDPSGLRYFPEELAERAFNAAVRSLTDTENVLDSAIADPERKRLRRQVIEDLQFLKENELIESFFPKATKDQLGAEGARAVIGVETAREVYLYQGGTVAGTGIPASPRVVEVPRRVTESFVGDGSLAAELAATKTYRFMTNTPLQSLLADEQLDANDPDRFGPTLLAQKMRVLQSFKKRIMNVRLRTLGIPEMDVFAYEINKRRIGLIVAEPRVPGTYHWLSGMYYAIDVTHKISPENGYTTEIELLVNDSNTQEEMLEVSFTFLENSDD